MINCIMYTMYCTQHRARCHHTLNTDTVHCAHKTLQVKVPSKSALLHACSSRSGAVAQGRWQILGLFTVHSLHWKINSLKCVVLYS